MARWLARLSYFDFEVEHRPGPLHGDADGLSRLPGMRMHQLRTREMPP